MASTHSFVVKCLAEKCPLILINGSDALRTAYPNIFGHYYQLQPNTYNSKHPFYAKTDDGSSVYIYYTGNHWAVSEIYGSGNEILFTDPTNETSSPPTTSQWKAITGGETASVTCESNVELPLCLCFFQNILNFSGPHKCSSQTLLAFMSKFIHRMCQQIINSIRSQEHGNKTKIKSNSV